MPHDYRTYKKTQTGGLAGMQYRVKTRLCPGSGYGLWSRTPRRTGDACAVRWWRPLRAARGRQRRRRGAHCACVLVEVVVVLCRGSAVRAAGAAMAQPGKLLKEQKYDRQLR